MELLSWGHSERLIQMHFFLEHPLGSKNTVEMFWILKALAQFGVFFLWFLNLAIYLFLYFMPFFRCFNCTFTIFPPSCGGISSESLPAGLFLHRCFIAFLVLQTAVLPTNLCLFQLNIQGKGKIRHHLMKNGRRDRCLVLSEKYRGESYKLTEYFWRWWWNTQFGLSEIFDFIQNERLHFILGLWKQL